MQINSSLTKDLITVKSLLLVAHGSRRKESNEEIAIVADALREKVQNQYQATQHAFLELAEPSIPDAIDQLVNSGSIEIIILPYFLSAGRHVHEDVPGIVNSKQKQYPNVKMHIAPYIGEAKEMIEVLAALSQNDGL